MTRSPVSIPGIFKSGNSHVTYLEVMKIMKPLLCLVAQYIKKHMYSYITEAFHFYFDSNNLKLLVFFTISFFKNQILYWITIDLQHVSFRCTAK